jgi:hypothetical protein
MKNLLSIAAAHFDRLRAEYRYQIDAIRRGMYLCGITESQLIARIKELDEIQFRFR